MTRMESYSGSLLFAQGRRAISSVSGDVMCPWCVNMCHFVPVDAVYKNHFISFHLMPFDKLIDVTWCHLMHQVSLVNAPTGSASLRNPLKVATISSNAWGQHLTDLGLSHFFQGEDELFETGWMCNLFYLYGSELTYRHLCASLLSAPSAVGPRWPRWLVRILCIYAQSGPNERWEYLRVCGLSHASRICGVATDFGPRCDPKLGRFRGVV